MQAVRIVFAAQASKSDYRDFPINRTTDLALGAGLFTVFAISAFYGYSTVTRCNMAKERHKRRSQQLPQSSPLQPPLPSQAPTPITHAPIAPGPVTTPPPSTVPAAPSAPDAGTQELQRNAPF